MAPRSGEEGSIALLSAVMIVMLVGFAALSIDIGSKYLIKRNLQSAVDAAALAATFGLNASPLASTTAFATNYLGYNGFPAAKLAATPVVTTGRYCPSAATVPPTPGTRFTATTSSSAVCPGDATGTLFGTGPNAVQVTASTVSPLLFGMVLLPGTASETVTATATATQFNEAGIMIGSGTASASTGATNSVLSGLFGNAVNLDTASYNGLLDTDINALDFANALAGETGLTSATYASLLATNVTLNQVLTAAMTVLGESNGITSGAANAAAALNGLKILDAAIAGSPTIPLSQLIDLGVLQNQGISAVNTGTALTAGINVYALSSLSAQLAEAATALAVPVTNLGVPGIATVSTATTVLGTPTAPSFAFGPVGTTVSTAQSRLSLSLSLVSALTLGTAPAPVVLPVYVQQAGATATITKIACGLSPSTDATVTVSAISGVAAAYIGTPSAATPITNLSTPVTVQPAPLVNLVIAIPLVGNISIAVSGRAETDLGAGAATSLTFTQANVAAGTVKTASSTGLTTNLLQKLSGSLVLTVSSTLLGVSYSLPPATLSLVTTSLTTLLTPVFAILDQVVDNILSSLGITLGYVNVTATGIRCGVPSLVL